MLIQILSRMNEKTSDSIRICVGTPSQQNSSLDLQYIRNISRDIGQGLRCRDAYHVVAVRSTVLPVSIESEVIPLLEKESGKRVGQDFGVCINPEFLREGSAIEDYYHPPFTLIGAWDQGCGATATTPVSWGGLKLRLGR